MTGFTVYAFAALFIAITNAAVDNSVIINAHKTTLNQSVHPLLEQKVKYMSAKFANNPVTSYLSKMSDKKWKELESIVKNDTLTKQDTLQQLQAWAAEQDNEFLTEFNKEMMEKSRVEAEIGDITRSLLKSLVTLYDQLQTVKNNMTITRRQEQQQLIKLMSKATDAITNALRTVEEEAARRVNSTKPYTSLITDLLAQLRVPAMRRRITGQGFAGVPEITADKQQRLVARPKESDSETDKPERFSPYKVPIFGTLIPVQRSYEQYGNE